MSETTSQLIFELKHQQMDFPRVPHPCTRIYVKFGPRGVYIQMFEPGKMMAEYEADLVVPFTTNIDVLYLDEPRAEELQLELMAINGEQVWISPEIE